MNNQQLISMLMKGNPQQIAMNMLQQQAGNNPIVQNALGMMQKNDTNGVELLVRNLCAERGVNPDQMLQDVKRQFGQR